jgi:hypothetical protein
MTDESDFRAEQEYLQTLYRLVDVDQSRTSRQLERLLAEHQSTPQGRLERDALVREAQLRLARLGTMSEGLCFGKVVIGGSGDRMYIGRLALLDEQGVSLLIDWRAPAAEAFYRATASEPMGIALRRHFITGGRTLLQLDDEVLDIELLEGTNELGHLVGSGALMAALAQRRSGRMGDIVSTIQREQDEIIRADADQVLVVAGGPGTGKTVVALHRAAYLLYTHRQQIAEDGVLVVGPSPLFLKYVEQVLPALGETAVVMLDWSSLLPGYIAEVDDAAEVQRLKGSARMVGLMRRCVRLFERAPRKGFDVRHIDGHLRHVGCDDLKEVRRHVRRLNRPHNSARVAYERTLARCVGMDAWTRETEGDPRAELNQRAIKSAADRLWPVLSAEEVFRTVFGSRRLLESVAQGEFDEEELAVLMREPDAPLSTSDIALLDELRALLGDRQRGGRVDDGGEAWREEVKIARENFADGGEADRGLPGFFSPELVAERFATVDIPLSVAERAADDPSWRYAHIIVDEAQDVSHMQWRALARRSRRSSMTVVGDLDQAAVVDGARWAERMGSVMPDADICVRGLSVNYRTPRELMDAATVLLRRYGTRAYRPAQYVRTGDVPRLVRTDSFEVTEIASVISEAFDALGDGGRVAVITPGSLRAAGCEAVSAVVGTTVLAQGVQRLDHRVAVFGAQEVKGLEFDAVVVVDPDGILAEEGWKALFVALTRATERLLVVSADEPSALVQEWLDERAVAVA